MNDDELYALLQLIKLWKDQVGSIHSNQDEAELINFVRTALPVVRPLFKLSHANEEEIIFTVDALRAACEI